MCVKLPQGTHPESKLQVGSSIGGLAYSNHAVEVLFTKWLSFVPTKIVHKGRKLRFAIRD